MKKIVSLMFLLSPFCARAMDAAPGAAPESETPLSPRTQCLRTCNTSLIEMVKNAIAQLPDETQITELPELIEVAHKANDLKTLEQSLKLGEISEIKISKWQEAQRLLSDQIKETFLRKIIQDIRESK